MIELTPKPHEQEFKCLCGDKLIEPYGLKQGVFLVCQGCLDYADLCNCTPLDLNVKMV